VLSGIPVVAKAAETAIALRRLTGSIVSRRGAYGMPPPEARAEFLAGRW
jgi:hypothetical protein